LRGISPLEFSQKYSQDAEYVPGIFLKFSKTNILFGAQVLTRQAMSARNFFLFSQCLLHSTDRLNFYAAQAPENEKIQNLVVQISTKNK
jgi:hypothetical protein